MENPKEKIFEVIDHALDLAGFDILDGDRDSVIVRDAGNDLDFEIKVEELVK